MKFKPIPLIVTISLPLLFGCVGTSPAPKIASETAPLDEYQTQVLATPSTAQGTAALLRRGHDAAKNNDAEGMMHVAEQLFRLEAYPLDGQDMADSWASQASAMGAQYRPTNIMRGRTVGPGYRDGQIGPHSQFATRQNFNAGQRAEIIIVPLDGARLSLQVSNDEGRSLCRVAASTRNLGCRFVPAYTGANLIEVSNDSDTTVSFYIVLN